MSLASEKAAAARWVASKVGTTGLTDSDAARLWGELSLILEDCRSDGGAILAIYEWRSEVERRLSTRLLHAPLKASDG